MGKSHYFKSDGTKVEVVKNDPLPSVKRGRSLYSEEDIKRSWLLVRMVAVSWFIALAILITFFILMDKGLI